MNSRLQEIKKLYRKQRVSGQLVTRLQQVGVKSLKTPGVCDIVPQYNFCKHYLYNFIPNMPTFRCSAVKMRVHLFVTLQTNILHFDGSQIKA